MCMHLNALAMKMLRQAKWEAGSQPNSPSAAPAKRKPAKRARTEADTAPGQPHEQQELEDAMLEDADPSEEMRERAGCEDELDMDLSAANTSSAGERGR